MPATVKCPNCNQTVPSDSNYCIFCSYRLSGDAYAPDPTPSPSGGHARIIKKCPNCGESFNDAILETCPKCGFPFVSPEPEPRETWRCKRGHINSMGDTCCVKCGLRRGDSPDPIHKSATEYIPAGMYTPTDDDLLPKQKRTV